MSSIDNRIVQMQFDNSQFEKETAKSLKTIENLKKSLMFDDAEKSLDSLQKAGDSFSLAKMAKGVEQLTDRFSTMGIIGMRVIQNLTDKAMAMGSKFVKSISTDQITAGFSKYAEKTKAVQQIVNATGLSIEQVNTQLEKLNWFTDETSYSFTDMVSNIGKFTSMNIPLEKSVTAMQGISTWAALSGAGVQEASRAMYNLSQAIGLGSVKMQDWKSIALANMATAEFKQTAIDTAIAMGKLKKGAVTLDTFESTLSKGWFTSDVLMEVLGKYGSMADEIFQVYEEQGVSTSEAMELLGDKMDSLGGRAFRAAQEAKTFSDAIEATKDAVSSNWMNIFENIFGNYEEAKVLWTDLANWLWEVFASPIEATANLFGEWKELGGRAEMLEGIYDIFSALKDIITAVGAALADVFPPVTVENLQQMSTAVKEFGANFKELLNIKSFKFVEFTNVSDKVNKLMKESNFQLGERSDKVKELQDGLVKLNVLEEKFATGIYDETTKNAFDRFSKGLTGVSEQLENTFTLNDKGEKVKELQQQLKELGFDPGEIDGIYGKKTQGAYERYVKSLESADKIRKDLQKGQKGDDVKRLQEMLNASGLADQIQADGIFGPKTEAALKQYQKAKGLTETGILDTKTMAVMFGETTVNSIEKAITEYEKYSDGLTTLQRISRGAFSILGIGVQIFGFLGKAVGAVASVFSPLVNVFITFAAAIGDAFYNLNNWLKESGTFDAWIEKITKFLEPARQAVEKFGNSILNFFGLGEKSKGASETAITFQKLWKSVKDSIKATGVLDKLSGAWDKFRKSIEKVKPKLKAHWETFKKSLGEKFTSFVTSLPGKIAAVGESLGNFASGALDFLTKQIEKLPGFIDDVKKFFSALFQPASKDGTKSAGVLNKVGSAIKGVFEALFGSTGADGTKKIGWITRIGRLLSGNIEGFLEGMDEGDQKKWLARLKSISLFIRELKEKIKTVIDTIKGLFTGEINPNDILPPSVIKAFNWIKEKGTLLINTIKENVIFLWNGLGAVFSGDNEGIKKFIEQLKQKVVSMFESIGEWIVSTWENFKTILKNAWNKIKEFYDNASDTTKKIIKKALVIAAVIGAIYLIYSIFKAAYNILDNIAVLKGKQPKKSLSESLQTFAISIAIISASVAGLSFIPKEKLNQGLKTLGIIAGAIIGISALSAIFLRGKAGEAISKISKAMMSFAIAVGVLAAVTIVLSHIGWGRIFDGLGKVALISVVLIGVMAALNKLGVKELKVGGLIGLAAAIGILAIIVGIVGKWKIKTIAKGIGALYGIVGALILLVKAISKTGSGNIKTGGLIGIALAVAILAYVASKLGEMDLPSLAKGVGSVAVISAIIAGLVAVFGSVGKNINTGSMIATLLGISAVIAVFGYILTQIKDVDPTTMIAFSGSLALALAAFVAACLIANELGGAKAMISGAAGIGGSILVLVGMLGGMLYALGKIDELSKGDLVGSIQRGSDVLQAVANALTPFIDSAEECATIVGYLIASEIIGKIPGGPLAMITGGLAISGSITILVGAISSVIIAIGKLDELASKDCESVAKRGADVLQEVSRAMKSFGDIKTLIPVIAGYLVLSEVTGLIPGGALAMTLGSLSIDAAIVGLIGGVSGTITAIGKLDELASKDCESVAKRGADILQEVSRAMKSFGDIKTLIPVIAGYLVLSEVTGLIPGGALAMIGGSLAIDAAFASLIGGVTAVVGGLGKLDDALGGGVKDAIDRGGEVLYSLANSIGQIRAGYMAAYNDEILRFGEGMAQLSTNIDGLGSKEGLDSDIQKAIEIATTIKGFFDGLTPYTLDLSGIEGYNTAAASLFTDMGLFGFNIGIFRTSIKGLDAEESLDADTEKAIGVAKTIHGFFTDITPQIPSGSGLKAFNKKLDSLITHIGAFGSVMGRFETEIHGLSETTIEDDTATAVSAAKAVSTFLADMKLIDIERNKDALDKWFTGDTKANTVIDSIAKLGESMGSAATNLSGLGAEGSTFTDDMTAVKTVLTDYAGFLNWLATGGLTIPDPNVDWEGSAQNFNAMLTSITQMVGTIDTVQKQLNVSTDVQTFISDITQLMTAFTQPITTETSEQTIFSQLKTNIEELQQILSGEGEYAITTDNFLGGISAEDIANKLTKFTEDLGSSISTNSGAIGEYTQSFNTAGQDLATSFSSGMATVDTSGIGTAVSSAVDEISGYSSKFSEAGSTLIKALGTGMKSTKADVSGASDTARRARDSANSYKGDFVTVGKNFVLGLAEGMRNNSTLASAVAAAVAREMLAKAKEALGITSPSKEGALIGAYFVQGIANGTKKETSMASDATENVAKSMLSTAENSLISLSSLLAEDIDDTPVISPVVDLTNARNAASSIGSMFGDQSFAVSSRKLASSASSSYLNRVTSKNADVKTAGTSIDNSSTGNVTFTNNTFSIRNDQDIYSLANEIATIATAQNRAFGASKR